MYLPEPKYATTERMIEAVRQHWQRIIAYNGRPYDLIWALRDGEMIHPLWEDYGLVTGYDGLPR